ncbi:MAG: type II toxin-antitoxin system VapC family toxin [Bryobacteraceae bacterium]
MDYWDTSALFKLYIPEDDSGYFLDFVVSSDQPIMCSTIGVAEMLCALCRRESAGDLKTGGALATYRRFLGDCRDGRIVRVPCGEQVITAAEEIIGLAFRRPRPVMLRSLDAIHVASAVTARARVMVSTDTRLREVAAMAKLKLAP